MERGKKMLELCAEGPPLKIGVEYAIIEVLELKSLHMLPKTELKLAADLNLWEVTLANKKKYQALIVHTGEKGAMEKLLRDLIRYRALRKQYKHLSTSSQSTQTEPESKDQTTKVTPPHIIEQSEEPLTDAAIESSMEIHCPNANISPLLPILLKTITYQEDSSHSLDTPIPTDEREPEEEAPTITSLVRPHSAQDYWWPTASHEHDTFSDDVLQIGYTPIPHEKGTEEEVPTISALGEPSSAQEDVLRMDYTQISTEKGPDEELPTTVIGGIAGSSSAQDEELDNMEIASMSSDGEGPHEVEPTIENLAGPSSIQGESRTKARKKQFCIFCNKIISNLLRHIVSRHPNEPRVMEIKALQKNDARRGILVSKMRTEGYVKMCAGEKVVIRKGGKVDYVKCDSCAGYFGKNTLHRHYAKCSGLKQPKGFVSIRDKIERLSKKDRIGQELKERVLPQIKCEKLIEAIENDQYIIDYGNSSCIRFGDNLARHAPTIRNQIRTLAKIKIMMAEMDDTIKTLVDIFHPEKFDNFIKAVQKHAKLDKDNLLEKSPSNVQHVGLLISKVAKNIKARCPLTKEGERLNHVIQRWLDLFDREYRNTVGWMASKLAVKKTWQSEKKWLPLASDVIKLNKYLKENHDSSLSILKRKFDLASWESLSKSVMILLLLFNRKRVGEIDTITLEDYERRKKLCTDSEVYKSLSETEKRFANQYFHLTIRGKLTRPVNLLINEELARSIDVLIKFRKDAGVDDENKLLFARQGPPPSYFVSNEVLRRFADDCGAEKPSHITGTNLRRQIATVSQALNLSDSDLKVLCGFLGHTKQTHLDYYRLPSDAAHTARVSRVLTALDAGKIHRFRGKTIEEIDVDVAIGEDADENVDDPEPSEMETEVSTGVTEDEPPRTPEKSTTAEFVTPSPKKRRIKWSTPERREMKRYFGKNLASGTLPSRVECSNIRKKVKVLHRRSVETMKAWVSNQLRKRKAE